VTAAWARKRLGEVLSVQNGFAFDSKAFGNVGFPLIRIRDLKLGTSTETRYAGEFESRYIVNSGDFLIGMDGEFGCYEWKGERALLNQRVCRLHGFGQELEPRFLFHGINAHLKAIEEVTGYTTVKHLSSKQILGIDLLIPSRTEQRRIVAILDEAFEGIATAKAHAEKNLRNARELFAGHLQAVFSQRGPGWVTKTVQQWVDAGVLAKPQDGNHGEIHPTKADYVDAGVPFIMAADMMNGVVDTERCRFISKAQASALRIGFAKTGDVLLSHKGTIGRVAILVTSDDYVILTPQVTYYRSLDGNRLFNGFLHYCLLSPAFQAVMNHVAGAGSTRAYIGITRQLDLQLTLPPVDAQRETAARLRRMDEASNRLAGVYETKLTTLDELKQSLLHQAFSGQL
jgi:type I restriction enzyme S subunit